MTTPFTPRPASRARRHKTLGLSAKQFSKVAGTLASARRGLREVDEDVDEEEEEELEEEAEEERDRVAGLGEEREKERERDGTRPGPSRWTGIHPETSFAAESSFLRAPLNSRLPPPAPPPVSPKGKGKARADHHHERERDRGKGEDVRGLSKELQEAMVLEDLLFVLMGIEGTNITYSPDSPHVDDPLSGAVFVCAPSLDPSIRDLISRMLPIATHYTALLAFIEQKSELACGLVNHALCGALRAVLQEHVTLLTRLEHAFLTPPSAGPSANNGSLTLHSLLPHLAPTSRTLSLLFSLANSLLLSPAGSESGDSDAVSSIDEEEERRNRELGLGGMRDVLKGLGAVDDDEGEVLGGEVVCVVWECMRRTAGDPLTPTLLTPLLARLSRPYARILLLWVEHGYLQDPHGEFFVREQKGLAREVLERDYTDEYWDRRYTLRDGTPTDPSAPPTQKLTVGVPAPRHPSGRLPGGACVPPFLEPWKRKVLLAGKYLNVIRECGREGGERGEEWEGGMDSDRFYRRIEDAYTHANRTLLTLLVEDQQLIPRLRSLKRYFFLSQSAFFTHFLDLSATELRKPSRAASLVKLQSLLELAMNAPDEGVGGYREDVKVTMATSGLYEWLLKVVGVSGAIGEGWGGASEKEKEKEKEKKEEKDKKVLQAIDALTLDYTVTFPLSLVISRKTILRYQLLFRFLLHLKNIEQSLLAMWLDHCLPAWRGASASSSSSAQDGRRSATPSSAGPAPTSELENWRRRVFSLRARMLAFVQNVLAYATFEVLEPNWRKLEAKLEKVATVDQLLKDHVDFLDTCLKECMLTSSKLLKVYSRLLVTCSTFALYTSSFTKSAKQADEAGGPPAALEMQKRWEFLAKFEANYNHSFKVCLDCVQYYASSENVALLALVVRLNNVRVT